MNVESLLPEIAGSSLVFEAKFSRDVADVDDGAYVIREAYTREDGPCPWPPRDGVLPIEGDRCLVYAPLSGLPWVIGWWPYA